ncbi:hypothetical protein AQUCO_03400426v1 [Aquilegia coerulea]|uniref:GOLD domain-containing protein n=1 Tax=Aquilegia coerulea TaxID=218851 RepID=A0A2G5CZ32_AQUCA|nr:hypothetical protein AQUCO_03400426v1 [Aquilegia coerulea]
MDARFRSLSLNKETYVVSDLSESKAKALRKLKTKIWSNHVQGSMWGISLADEGDQADISISGSKAFGMLLKSLDWRRNLGVDEILTENLDFDELEDIADYVHGFDREGRPVYYSFFGVFQDEETFAKYLGNDYKKEKYIRWRIQILERCISLLHFQPRGINSAVHVIDLEDMPTEKLSTTSKQMKSIISDYYPELFAREIFINSVENIPLQYGGLSQVRDIANGPPKSTYEFTIPAREVTNFEMGVFEAGANVKWDILVLGWDLEFGVQFIASTNEESYTIIEYVHMIEAIEGPMHNNFTCVEAGKIVFSFNNRHSSEKKVVAYPFEARRSRRALANQGT